MIFKDNRFNKLYTHVCAFDKQVDNLQEINHEVDTTYLQILTIQELIYLVVNTIGLKTY